MIADSDVYEKPNSDHLYHFYMDVNLHSPSPQSYFALLSAIAQNETIMCKLAPLKDTVQPRFNEVPRDWGNWFVISRVRYTDWNLDLTKCQGTGEVGSLYRGSFPYILLLLG